MSCKVGENFRVSLKIQLIDNWYTRHKSAEIKLISWMTLRKKKHKESVTFCSPACTYPLSRVLPYSIVRSARHGLPQRSNIRPCLVHQRSLSASSVHASSIKVNVRCTGYNGFLLWLIHNKSWHRKHIVMRHHTVCKYAKRTLASHIYNASASHHTLKSVSVQVEEPR